MNKHTYYTNGNLGVRMIKTPSFTYVVTYKRGIRQVHGSSHFDLGYWTGTKWQFDDSEKAEKAKNEYLKLT